MWNRTTLQVDLLVWGCVFCLIATLSMVLSNQFDKEKRQSLMWMQFFTAILLASDALAYIFRGDPGEDGYIMVRISNFLVFLVTDIVLLFFHIYVCCHVYAKKQREKIYRVKAGYLLSVVGMVLVIISQFTGLYYSFDAKNFYHRNHGYFISMVIPVIVMILDFSILFQHRKKLSRRIYISMLSYIFLPLFAVVIQFKAYGLSLINSSIGISMIIMFLAAMSEQNQEMNELTKKNSEVEARLEIATTLNRCVSELSSDTDIQVAIYNLLHTINDYFKADRAYIFEIDFERNVIVNTHEYVKNGVTEEMDNLQEVPLQAIDLWLQNFQKNEVYYIADLDQEKGHSTYEILKEQNIESLLAVPLRKERKMIGFLGVDNPQKHYDDPTLLSSMQYFITNSLSMKKQQEWLEYLSYRDMLTKLYNRNKYIEVVESYENKEIVSVGAVYIDLNNLKKLNDQQGHEAGDRYICHAAAVLGEIFPQNAYRVGGDEFVVLVFPMEKEIFYQKIKQLQKAMLEKQVSISLGALWKEKTNDVESLLKKADELMYQEKEKYHQQRR